MNTLSSNLIHHLSAPARAVALRRAVRDGWDAEAVAQALLTLREPTLW